MTFSYGLKAKALEETSQHQSHSVLCFASSAQLQHEISETFSDHNIELSFVSSDLSSVEQSFYINPEDPQAYSGLFTDLDASGVDIDTVIYLWGLEADGDFIHHENIFNLINTIAKTNNKVEHLILGTQINLEDNAESNAHKYSWFAYERSLRFVLPDCPVSVIAQELSEVTNDKQSSYEKKKSYLAIIKNELQQKTPQSVLYRNKERNVYQAMRTQLLDTVNDNGVSDVGLRQGGTYIIFGGLGGLGLLFAEYLQDKCNARLVLVGRSSLDDKRRKIIERFNHSDKNTIYIQADVCNRDEVNAVLKRSKEEFSSIAGVFNAAGATGQESIIDKSWPSFKAMLSIKATGSLILHEVFSNVKLDFICHFSSSAAILGDFGSCDYALGNRFQMAFAEADKNIPSFVINWPLWADGGLSVGGDKETELYLSSSGQALLNKQQGLQAFEQILNSKAKQQLVLVASPDKVESLLSPPVQTHDGSESNSLKVANRISSFIDMSKPLASEKDIGELLTNDISEIVSALLKLSVDLIDADVSMTDFGFDSISLTKLAREVSDRFKITITPATFFTYSTISSLAEHCCNKFTCEINVYYQAKDAHLKSAVDNVKHLNKSSNKNTSSVSSDSKIAIVGMSGRFPKARNIDDMWKIMLSGQEAVTSAPYDRSDEWGTTAARCGFVDGIAEFDAAFFGITPKEAKLLDPRQRLLLQESWNALEDAGYTRFNTKGMNLGVFVGIEEGDYSQICDGEGSITSNHSGILAARLAYLLDSRGPTMAINTACSSGLVAVHQACQSIHNGECETAIAAAVSLLVTPTSFNKMSEAGMLSPDYQCRAFSNDANGMVPSEAVVTLVLKKLSEALEQKDPVYAVIDGSAINSDGKTNGITAPNGEAQSELLKSLYARYDINPEKIQHVIAHGTGTKLGDPVEVEALDNAFSCYTDKKQYCAITSAKSNFGHTLAASGLVSLVAMVKSLNSRIIPPTLHCESTNEYFSWENSPFYVNKVPKEWDSQSGVRTGAVSAFGMSGTNCHIVLSDSPISAFATDSSGLHLLVLSARNEKSLSAKVQSIYESLDDYEKRGITVAEICATLLLGRKNFRHRRAWVVRYLNDIRKVLRDELDQVTSDKCFSGLVKEPFISSSEDLNAVNDLSQTHSSLKNDSQQSFSVLEKLAGYFCQGYNIHWYAKGQPQRVNLVGYPFSRDRHWPNTIPKHTDDYESAATFAHLIESVKDGSFSVEEAVEQVSVMLE